VLTDSWQHQQLPRNSSAQRCTVNVNIKKDRNSLLEVTKETKNEFKANGYAII
jgi:hypothetical protein